MLSMRRVTGALLLGAILLCGGAPQASSQDKPKEAPRPQLPNIQFPDIEKLLPQGLDPDQIKELKRQLEQAQQEARKAIEDLQKQFPGQLQPFQGGRFGFGANRLGATLTKPSEALVDQLGLPQDEGLVLNNVKPDSAADKAGLKKNDILLELGGKKVPSQVNEFTKMLNDFKTGDKVDAVVLRKGKRETIKDVTLPEVPKNANPRFNIPRIKIGPDGKIEIDGVPNLPNIQGIPKIQILPNGNLQGLPKNPQGAASDPARASQPRRAQALTLRDPSRRL